MSYANFVPTVWAEGINRALERNYVYVEDCYRKYEGDVKQMGDQVTIPGIGSPTITEITIDSTRSNSNPTIADAEEVEGSSTTLIIDHMAYFNYMVGDVDRAQAVNGIMDALSDETSERLAGKVDTYISSLAVAGEVDKLNEGGAVQVTTNNVLDTLDAAIQKLYENDVSTATEIVVTVSPRFFTIFKKAYIALDTNNSKMIENGKVARYGNAVIKMSNNVHRTASDTATAYDADGGIDNIMIRTKRAIAFAQPLTHTEAYRPERKFADAVKGFILYGAKVVRPKEILNINVKYTA